LYFKKLDTVQAIDMIQDLYQVNWYKQPETLFFKDIKKIVFGTKFMHVYIHQQKKLCIEITEPDMIDDIKKALVVLGPIYRNNFSCIKDEKKDNNLKQLSFLMIVTVAYSVHSTMGILAIIAYLVYNTIFLYRKSHRPPTYIESFEYDFEL
jgi:hypothetical protein